MTEFNECATCSALTTPTGAKPHAADHAHTARRIDALTRKNTDYLQEVASLRAQIDSYGRQLADHPITAEPDTVVVSPAPEFDADDLGLETADTEDSDSAETSQYADENVGDTIPITDDAMANLYTPRNLI